METVIAFILLFIMILLDTHSMERFLTITSPIKNKIGSNIKKSYNTIASEVSELSKGNLPLDIIPKQLKQTLWIYNDFSISSRHWTNFYSRKFRQPTSAIINLCIKSIIKHADSKFNIRIFTQDDISELIPEYINNINPLNSEYMKYNFIKYAILYKYGGIWIPKDTIMLRPLSYSINFDCKYITTFGSNNNNYVDNKGVSDNIIAVPKNHILVKNMLAYLLTNSLTFQNALVFKQSINKYLNKLLSTYNYHNHANTSIIQKCNGMHFNLGDLFTTNIIKFRNGNEGVTINININEINNLREYNYLLRMSEKQILTSNLFIGVLLKKSLL